MNSFTEAVLSAQTANVATTSKSYGVSVSVVCCESRHNSINNVRDVARSIEPLARTAIFVLSCSNSTFSDVQVVPVPEGTKLSKLRHFSTCVDSDFICICDPDLEVNQPQVKALFEQAFNIASCGREIVAYGLVDCQSDDTLLSRLISIDKWLSHRVLRPALWKCGIGITIPGQFLFLSTSVLQRLRPEVDSYLDDLYLGWIARSTKVFVLRVPVVVGREESRLSWSSLLLQRLRWMRGFFGLVKHLSIEPAALKLLFAHFVAYHGLPIMWLTSLLCAAILYPTTAFVIFGVAAIAVSILSGQSLKAAFTFMLVFPLLHGLATLLWWIPISRQRLTQR